MIGTLPEALAYIERLNAEKAALEVRVMALETLLGRRTEQVTELQNQMSALQEQMRGLQRKLGQDSSNSSKPPSSDAPWQKKRTGKKSSGGRKRGGQKGHKGWFRTLVLVHYTFPEEHWDALRTTNPIERVNKEFKRRSKSMEVVSPEGLKVVLAFTALRLEFGWSLHPITSNSLKHLKSNRNHYDQKQLEEVSQSLLN